MLVIEKNTCTQKSLVHFFRLFTVCLPLLQLYIANMVVHPQFRRQGIARTILRQCHLLARRWREPAVYLHVDKTNQWAIELYKSEGYELVRDYGYVDIRILMKKTIPLEP